MSILHHAIFDNDLDQQSYSQSFSDSNKPCLIVLHGLFGEASNWRQLAQEWSQRYCVVAMDLRNHGHSFTAQVMTYSIMAKDVLATMKSLGITAAHVLGHSMGGKVAMQMALLAPEQLHSLIIADIAPVAYELDRHDSIFAGLYSVDLATLGSRKQALATLNHSINDMRVCQFLGKSLYKTETQNFAWRFNLDVIKIQYSAICASPVSGLIDNHITENQNTVHGDEAADEIGQTLPYLAKHASESAIHAPFSKPVLILKGAQSDYIQKQHAPVFQALFPYATIKIIPNTGHWLHAENPAMFGRLVDRFIENQCLLSCP